MSVTREDVLKAHEDAAKMTLDYVDQGDARLQAQIDEIRDMQSRITKAAKAVNEMLDSDEKATKDVRKAHAATGKALKGVRAIKSKLKAGKTVSDKEIEEAQKDVATIEEILDQGETPTAPEPPKAPETAPTVEVKTTAIAAAATPTEPHTATHVVRTRQWGWITFLSAAIGLLAGVAVSLLIWNSFFPDAAEGAQWLRWIAVIAILALGLTAGGAIGSYIESRRDAD